MERGITGRYEVTRVGGEEVRAFVPAPLPPIPPVDLSGARQRLPRDHGRLAHADFLHDFAHEWQIP